MAANFIKILKSTAAEMLPAPCDFIVDNFNSSVKSALDYVALLTRKKVKSKNIPLWRIADVEKKSK